MRDKIVAGNWKMNKTAEDARILVSEVVNMVKDELHTDIKMVLAPPYPFLDLTKRLIDSPKIYLAAQNCSEHPLGAYTGEIAADMLESIGCTYVIIGHSERRECFKESNEQLAEKVNQALENNLLPIFCCGESLAIRESGTHIEFVCQQLTESLSHLSETDFAKVVVAYEPIWAIGTGVTASSEQAQEMHYEIRQHIASHYGNLAENTSILYGGSCKPDNAQELFACADVDGGLIGGASLKSRDFVDIGKAF